MKVLVFGEILWDIIEGTPHLGGAPLNFAAHVKQCGQESAMVSCLGKDDLGDRAEGLVKEMGVDVSMVQRSDKQTGYVPVKLIDGQPDYEIVKDVAYDYIQSEALDQKKIASFGTFYFGSIIQRNPVSNAALQSILDQHQFDNIFYDVNLRKDSYSSEVIKSSLAYCTILKVNDEEVSVISKMIFQEEQGFEKFCKSVTNSYLQIKTIIITAGKDGSFVFANGVMHAVSTEPIKVVDTVGAGDSFSAAFAYVFAKTNDPIKAAKIANKVGGFVASNAGPNPVYSKEIKELMRDV
jgi:fructokinase